MLRKIFLYVDAIVITILVIVGLDYTNYVANIKYVSDAKTVILDDVVNLNIDDRNIVVNNLQYNTPIVKKFEVENLSDQDSNVNILFNDIENDFENELVYELFEGQKVAVSQTILPRTNSNGYVKLNINLKPSEKKEYTIKFTLLNKANQPIETYQGKKFSAILSINSLKISSEIKTATNFLIANNNINQDESVEDAGLYRTDNTDNGIYSYYYKGMVDNNYVKFNNELWRIIRINEDGSIRIIKDENIKTNIVFNVDKTLENSNDFMSSNVRNELNNYYNTNLKRYENLLQVENYCMNDVIVKNDNYKTSDNDKTYQEYEVNLKCGVDTKSYVGLLSYNEAVKSGLKYSTNSQTYLNSGIDKNTWMFNKAGVNSRTRENYVWYLDENSIKETVVSNDKISIRPVINLKGTLNIIGNGTLDNPYIFVE